MKLVVRSALSLALVTALASGAIAQSGSDDQVFEWMSTAQNAAIDDADFDTAIINFKRARVQAQDSCVALRAAAGETAATDAKALLQEEGMESRPTQYFFARQEELLTGVTCGLD